MFDGGWTPRKQCKHMLRHMITDLGMDVKFSSYFSCMDMMEALNGTVGDKKSYQDFGYFGVLGADFDDDGVAVGEYSPKPSYYTLSYLASIFAEDIEAIEVPIIVHNENAPHCGNLPSVYCGTNEAYGFRLNNGSLAYAYWYPVNHMTCDFEGAISFTTSDLGEPKLVDLLDGAIYEIPEEMIERHPSGSMVLHLLPIKDYPLLLVFGELE